MYVHTCNVLTNPPIPSSPCNHIVILRPIFFYIARELTQGSPCNVLIIYFFIFPSLYTEICFSNVFSMYLHRKNLDLIPCKRLEDMMNIFYIDITYHSSTSYIKHFDILGLMSSNLKPDPSVCFFKSPTRQLFVNAAVL